MATQRLRILAGTLATALTASLAAVAVTAAPATASTQPPFYQTPSSLPSANGAVIRSEPMTFYYDPLKLTKSPASATRIMYKSTDRTGAPIAVTGTVLVPSLVSWPGPGPRPVIGYAVGTQGLGDHCAPSRQLAAGSEYEGTFIQGLLARGYVVAVTDYQGLGTDGVHTYMNRQVSGQVVIDSVRAALNLPQVKAVANNPVAITGYSQGGGAAAAAAELLATYGAGLNVKGVAAGAPPADLAAVARNLDGSLYFGFLAYATRSLAAGYGMDAALESMLNADGRAVMAAVETQCTTDSLAKYPFWQSKGLTKDGRPITAHLGESPWQGIVDGQLIGRAAPRVPLLISHSTLDDVIPYPVGRGLASRWCDRGARVDLDPNLAPTHVGGALASYPDVYLWLEGRFLGLTSANDCWAL